MEKSYLLKYDQSKWKEKISEPVNMLELFITNKCNLRCNGCFYKKGLGTGEMSLDDYKKHICEHISNVKKIILLGGEPTLHPNINEMIEFNNTCGLRTIIYTNGYAMNRISKSVLNNTDVRASVYGFRNSEKPIIKIARQNFPTNIVMLLRKDNTQDLHLVAKYAEENLGCRKFFISGIRDMVSGNHWIDTPETLPLSDYFKVVQNFVINYDGAMEIHISRRGILETVVSQNKVSCCRIGNIFPNGKKIICPFDICKRIMTDELSFGTRICNKNNGNCLFQKIVLVKK